MHKFSLVSILLFSNMVHATYSLVATEAKTQSVGYVIASCIGKSTLSAFLAPGYGVAVIQHFPPTDGHKNIVPQLLHARATPRMILQQSNHTNQGEGWWIAAIQTGIAVIQPEGRDIRDIDYLPLGYTGIEVDHRGEAMHLTGHNRSIRYSAQGNVLHKGTVAAMVHAFEQPACDFPERLYNVLVAIQENPKLGDNRCRDLEDSDSLPADSMAIELAIGEEKKFFFQVPRTEDRPNPFPTMQDKWEEWRAENQCVPAVAIEPPFKETIKVPGRVQFEDFREGGQGVAYNENDDMNWGRSSYRKGGVDIGHIFKYGDVTGKYFVGWVGEGEWLTYDIDVEFGDRFGLEFRSGAAGGNATLAYEIDGKPQKQKFHLKDTSHWTDFGVTDGFEIDLPKGRHTLKFIIESGGANLDWFEIKQMFF